MVYQIFYEVVRRILSVDSINSVWQRHKIVDTTSDGRLLMEVPGTERVFLGTTRELLTLFDSFHHLGILTWIVILYIYIYYIFRSFQNRTQYPQKWKASGHQHALPEACRPSVMLTICRLHGRLGQIGGCMSLRMFPQDGWHRFLSPFALIDKTVVTGSSGTL